MTYDTNLTISLYGDTWLFDKATRSQVQAQQLIAIARAILGLGWQPPGLPAEIKSYTKKLAVREDWFEKYAAAGALDALWPDGRSFLLIDKGAHVVKLNNFVTRIDPRGLTKSLATIPFQTACLGHNHFSSQRDLPDGWYERRGLPGVHYPIGLGLALRGRGHLTLVSRRWLTHGGSWRVLRGANDTTFVQLYDLGAPDQQTAWEQAKASYERITYTGNGPSGIVELTGNGYIDLPTDAKHDPGTKRLVVMVGERDVTTKEMRDLCEYRFNSKVKPPEMKWLPIETIAYVFLSEARARHHLHELWLRDLECWYEVDGRRTRIDDAYDPPAPPPPAWVAEADAREAKARSGEPSY